MTTPIRADLAAKHNPLLPLLITLPFAAMAQEDELQFTDHFPVEECSFTPFGGNEFFSLMPGRRTYFDNWACVAAGECDLQAGNFDDCIEVTETTPLEPGSESTKVYCPGVGLVLDNELEATAVER